MRILERSRTPLIFLLTLMQLTSCVGSKGVSKEECQQNALITVLVVPFRDDAYGVTDAIIESYNRMCYNMVHPTAVVALLAIHAVEPDTANELELIELGKQAGADYVVFGTAFTVDVPYVAPSRTNRDGTYTFGDAFAEGLARGRAGTWVSATAYSLDVLSGQKTTLLLNHRMWKV